MAWLALAFLTMILAALSSHFLIAAILEGSPRRRRLDYTILALQVGRWYRVFSWAIVTFILLATLVSLFWQAADQFL